MVLGPTVRYRNVFSNNTQDRTEMGASCLISRDYSMQMDRRTIPRRWYSDALRKSKSRSNDQASESQLDLAHGINDGDRTIDIFLFLNNQQDVLIIQIFFVIKLYMFRASSLPIIRSFLLYIRHW